MTEPRSRTAGPAVSKCAPWDRIRRQTATHHTPLIIWLCYEVEGRHLKTPRSGVGRLKEPIHTMSHSHDLALISISLFRRQPKTNSDDGTTLRDSRRNHGGNFSHLRDRYVIHSIFVLAAILTSSTITRRHRSTGLSPLPPTW